MSITQSPNHPNQPNHANHFNHANHPNHTNLIITSITPITPITSITLITNWKFFILHLKKRDYVNHGWIFFWKFLKLVITSITVNIFKIFLKYVITPITAFIFFSKRFEIRDYVKHNSFFMKKSNHEITWLHNHKKTKTTHLTSLWCLSVAFPTSPFTEW